MTVKGLFQNDPEPPKSGKYETHPLICSMLRDPLSPRVPCAMRRGQRGIMRHFSGHSHMEAERINALAGSLSDLDRRALELRRYL